MVSIQLRDNIYIYIYELEIIASHIIRLIVFQLFEFTVIDLDFMDTTKSFGNMLGRHSWNTRRNVQIMLKITMTVTTPCNEFTGRC